MDSARWQRVKSLFGAALELPLAERDAFIESACADDELLRQEVKKLLASFDSASHFMAQPAIGEVAILIVERAAKLKPGQPLAHYEIIRPLGAGGMGEVYLARDSRLNRQ